jgi:hypothetical protein
MDRAYGRNNPIPSRCLARPRAAPGDNRRQTKLLGITKRGRKYLRKLIIRAGHGNTRMRGAIPIPFGSRLPPRRSTSSARGIKNQVF